VRRQALLLLGIAIGAIAHAAAAPQIDLTATPAWKGWSRPGRTTEIEVRLSATGAVRAALDASAGVQARHAVVDLEPGRTLRMQLALPVADKVVVIAQALEGNLQRREIGIAQSESPLLGVSLVGGATVELDGFHSIALDAADLPHIATSYSSIDALIVDAPTLAALDRRQLNALLAFIAGCGRTVVLDPDRELARTLGGRAGCGGRALLHAVSPSQARELLDASLATALPAPIDPRGIGAPGGAGDAIWNRVAAALAACFAAAALAILFFRPLPAVLITSTLCTAALMALLHAMPARSRLAVWSEGESGVTLARYQAWQQVPGRVRERTTVRVPPLLASAAQPCDPTVAMRLDVDAGSGQATQATFDTRLFSQVSLCYAGSFPVSRLPALRQRSDGELELRNGGAGAWPTGVLIARGEVHELPALGPGAQALVGAKQAHPALPARLVHAARAHIPPDGAAALWPLDLEGIAAASVEANGWLLMTIATR
jgi:hypothetical protein